MKRFRDRINLSKVQKKLIFICLLFLSFGFVEAQKVEISGKVIDNATGEALPGANVMEKGTLNGTITDAEGSFSLSVTPNSVLVVSFVGYRPSEHTVTGEGEISIQLESDSKELDELVVIGYGYVKKSDLTGSVSSVSSKELDKLTMTSLEQGIQGKAAGVFVTTTDAAPGGGMSIQIRGANSMLGGTEPLYVIDGVPLSSENSEFAPTQFEGGDSGNSTQSSNVLSSLNPSDIESIEILKDASATAIYGSRGANGVVLITTKRGEEGKNQINFQTSFGMSKIANKLNVLDPITYAHYINEARYNRVTKHPITGEIQHGEPIYFDRDSVDVEPGEDPPRFIPVEGEGTDWQDAIYRTAITKNYSLGLSGGNSKTRYAITGDYLDQEGIIVSSQYVRQSLRINLDTDIKKWLTVGTSSFLSRSNNRMVSTSTFTDGKYGGTVKQALTANPVREISDWDPTRSPEEEETGSNPYVEATEPYNTREDTRLITDIYANVKIFEFLRFRTNAAVNYFNAGLESYYPRTTYRGFREGGVAVLNSNEVTALISESQLIFSKDFGKHRFNAVAVYSYEKTSYDTRRNQASGFLTDDLLMYSIGDGELNTYKMNNNYVETGLISYTSRLSYNYDERYLLTGTIRRDGSSKFGDGKKWGIFPSFAFAWRVSQENFIQSIEKINNLKLRVSWGQSGNQAIQPLQSKSILQPTAYPFGYPQVNQLRRGYSDYYAWFPNKNLHWETTSQTNVGIDLGVFNNRLTLSADYYYKLTDGLLQGVIPAFSTGFTYALQNAGKVQNHGLELQLGATILDGDFNWNINTNYSRNRNEILEIAPGYDVQFAPSLGEGSMKFLPFIQKPGLPIGAIWGYVEDGIFQNEEEVAEFKTPTPNMAPGEIRYLDISGPDGVPDSIINDYDRTLIGDVNPDFIIGLTNNFSYGRFDLSILLQGVFGHDILNQTAMRISGTYDSRSNILQSSYDERWQGEGTSTTQPQALVGSGRSLQFSDRFVEDASFVRLKNVRLSYTLLSEGSGKNYFNNLQVFVNAVNLLTFTNYSGYDPEVSAFGQDPSRRGVDAGSYPMSRTYTVGVNLNF